MEGIDGELYKAIGVVLEKNAQSFWDGIREAGRTIESCIVLAYVEHVPHPPLGAAYEFSFRLLFREDIPEDIREGIGDENLSPGKPGQLRIVVFGDGFRAGISLYPAMFGVSRGGQA